MRVGALSRNQVRRVAPVSSSELPCGCVGPVTTTTPWQGLSRRMQVHSTYSAQTELE
jgi:hypothetical protein